MRLEEMRLLGFHALHQDLTGTVSVFVDPRFEASVHCFIESPFIFPADEDVPITDCWLTRNPQSPTPRPSSLSVMDLNTICSRLECKKAHLAGGMAAPVEGQ